MTPLSISTTIAEDWSGASLRRLRHLLEQTPEAAPSGLTSLEAFALLEWGRMAVFAECHDAGAGDGARALLRGSLGRLSA